MQMHIHTVNIYNYYEYMYTHVTKNIPMLILCALTLRHADTTGWWHSPTQCKQNEQGNILSSVSVHVFIIIVNIYSMYMHLHVIII